MTNPSSTPAPALPPPGWYPDSAGATRWWDGHAWGPVAPPQTVPPGPIRQPSNGVPTTAVVFGALSVLVALLSWRISLVLVPLSLAALVLGTAGLAIALKPGGRGLWRARIGIGLSVVPFAASFAIAVFFG